ncbi:metal-dependent hydrolase [Metabacillus sp. RGM 3146]|uniref:metal-dependent hydrolase n=1 Tax=Metabacillus sp. RGM 3146 TaxID=3401092 RepID=UPI003B9B6772
MDTSTHIAFGIGFAGLAHLDPAVASNPALSGAILAGTVLGSNAPDFDYAVKIFKGKAMYIEHHRGISHSIPALFIWALLLTFVIQLFFVPLPLLHLFGWTLFAVAFHVLIDIFNVFGTQGGRPLTKKWLALNAVPLFDPFIMILHFAGFILWVAAGNPGLIFSFIYLILVVHVAERFIRSLRMKKRIGKEFANQHVNVIMIPTMRRSHWKTVAETEDAFHSGELVKGRVNWIHTIKKEKYDDQLIQIASTAKNARHFLKSTDTVYCTVSDLGEEYEIKWIDYRFRTGRHYPFMAIVIMSKDKTILSSCTGWIYQKKDAEERMEYHHSYAHGKNHLA